MAQNFDEFSIKEAMRLENSDAGQALYSAIKSSHSQDLQKVQQKLASGDIQGAKDAILTLMNTPEAKKALENLGGTSHG